MHSSQNNTPTLKVAVIFRNVGCAAWCNIRKASSVFDLAEFLRVIALADFELLEIRNRSLITAVTTCHSH